MLDENSLCQKDPAWTGQRPAFVRPCLWARRGVTPLTVKKSSEFRGDSEACALLPHADTLTQMMEHTIHLHKWEWKEWAELHPEMCSAGRAKQGGKKTVEGCSTCIHPSSFMLQSRTKPATKAIERTEHSPYPMLEYKTAYVGTILITRSFRCFVFDIFCPPEH